MAIIKATNKKQYAIEQKSLVRILASGIKLTEASMKAMDLKKGDKVNYGTDDTDGTLVLYKSEEGAVIGGNKTFTSQGFKSELLALANGAAIMQDGKATTEKVSLDTKVKGGLQIRFDVSTTPREEGGEKFFPVTFKEAVLESSTEEDEDETTDAAPATKTEKEDNF